MNDVLLATCGCTTLPGECRVRVHELLAWCRDKPVGKGKDLEEGEIAEPPRLPPVVGEWGAEQHTHAWLLLALFELLPGGQAGLDACQEAAKGAFKAAKGCPEVLPCLHCTCDSTHMPGGCWRISARMLPTEPWEVLVEIVALFEQHRALQADCGLCLRPHSCQREHAGELCG